MPAGRPPGDRPPRRPGSRAPRTVLTGTAQSVSNSVERARGHFKSHPATTAPSPKERKNFRRSKPKANEVEESEDDQSEGAGETEEGQD